MSHSINGLYFCLDQCLLRFIHNIADLMAISNMDSNMGKQDCYFKCNNIIRIINIIIIMKNDSRSNTNLIIKTKKNDDKRKYSNDQCGPPKM